MVVSSTPPGITSLARLEGWLNDNITGEPLELTDVQLIAGGRSNLTYRLTVSGPSGGRLLVLRRPPLGHVLPTAHDMSREFRVLSALAGTQVPVAPLVASCTDDDVIGAPFYVMEHVPGVVLRTRADTAVLTEPQAADLSRCLADMLAAIHGVDVAAVGLGDLGRGAGYLRRQLDRWQRQWELSATREMPGYGELVDRLTAALPAEGDVTLVHGDFRLDNALVTLSPRPRITAVVDWEMATLGDPLADLGLTLVYWTDPASKAGSARPAFLPMPPGCPRTPRPPPVSGPAPSSRPSTPGAPDVTSPGSATTWRSATSSSPWSWRAFTPATCNTRRSAKALSERAWPSRC